MRKFGGITALIGIIWCLIALNMDVSVERGYNPYSSSGYQGGGLTTFRSPSADKRI
jgi:hypothetical protein